MNWNLLKDAKIMAVEPSAVAGTSDLTTDIIDTQGYDSICFIAYLGDVTSGSVLALVANTNSANHLTVPTPVTLSSSVGGTAGATDADNKLMILDINKPRDRYVWAVLSRGTQNAVVNGIIAILYNKQDRPLASQDSSVYDYESLNDPSA